MDDRDLEFGHFSRSTAANGQQQLLCRTVVGVEGKRAFGVRKGGVGPLLLEQQQGQGIGVGTFPCIEVGCLCERGFGVTQTAGLHQGEAEVVSDARIVRRAPGGILQFTDGGRQLAGFGEQQRQAVQWIWTSAGGSPQAKGQVLSLNLHPDYFFGNQAWADWPTLALPGTRAGMRAEGPAYADNLYRLCGDWMKGTESTPSKVDATPGTLRVGQRTLALHRFQGHTDDDLVVLDPAAGVAYVGGLVFMNRVPTTPHANFDQWLASLDALEAILKAGNYRWVVPSHGPIHTGLAGLNQTRDWLKWLTTAMATHADAGRDLGEVLHQPAVPPRFADWAAMPAELHRSLTQWYPVYEKRALAR